MSPDIPALRLRPDLLKIYEVIPPGSRVLDLGAGSGDLLKALERCKGATVFGIDKSTAGIMKCIAKGIPIFQSNLDEGLEDYEDQSFDYVILSQTLQQVQKPKKIDLLRLLHLLERLAEDDVVERLVLVILQPLVEVALEDRDPLGDAFHDPGRGLVDAEDRRPLAPFEGLEEVAASGPEVEDPAAGGDNLVYLQQVRAQAQGRDIRTHRSCLPCACSV